MGMNDDDGPWTRIYDIHNYDVATGVQFLLDVEDFGMSYNKFYFQDRGNTRIDLLVSNPSLWISDGIGTLYITLKISDIYYVFAPECSGHSQTPKVTIDRSELYNTTDVRPSGDCMEASVQRDDTCFSEFKMHSPVQNPVLQIMSDGDTINGNPGNNQDNLFKYDMYIYVASCAQIECKNCLGVTECLECVPPNKLCPSTNGATTGSCDTTTCDECFIDGANTFELTTGLCASKYYIYIYIYIAFQTTLSSASQVGNKFYFTFVDSIPTQTSCNMINVGLDLLGSGPTCSSTTNILTIESDLTDATYAASDTIGISNIFTGTAETFTVLHARPQLQTTITPNRYDWDSGIAGNEWAVAITGGATLTLDRWTWTKISLPAITLTFNQSTQAYGAKALVLGEGYVITVTANFTNANWITFTHQFPVQLTRFSIVSNTQTGENFTIVVSDSRLVITTCAEIFDAETAGKMGSTPTCTCSGASADLFVKVSTDHTLVLGDIMVYSHKDLLSTSISTHTVLELNVYVVNTGTVQAGNKFTLQLSRALSTPSDLSTCGAILITTNLGTDHTCSYTAGTLTLTVYAGNGHTLVTDSKICIDPAQAAPARVLTTDDVNCGTVSGELPSVEVTAPTEAPQIAAITIGAAAADVTGVGAYTYVYETVSGPSAYVFSVANETSKIIPANTLVAGTYVFKVYLDIVDSGHFAPNQTVSIDILTYTLDISLTPNVSDNAESKATNTMGLVVGGYTGALGDLEVTWTQDSGPAVSSFNSTDMDGNTWAPGGLTLGDYQFSAEVRGPVGADWTLTATISFKVYVTLTSTTFTGNKLDFQFDHNINPPSACGDVLSAATLTILGTTPTCTSPQPTHLEVWFDEDANYQVDTQNIEFLAGGYLHGGPYTLTHDLPHLVVNHGGSYSNWEDRNLTGVATDIAGVTPAPTYTYTQLAGPQTVVLNYTGGYLFIPKGSVVTGTYDFQLRMDFPTEFRSFYREVTASIVLSAELGEVVQDGNILTIRLTWGTEIGGLPTNEPVHCSDVVSTPSETLLAPSLCRHNVNTLTIFVSNVSSVVATNTITLITYPGYVSPISFPMPLDPPSLSLTGAGTFDSAANIVITGVPTSVGGVSPIYTWALLSGPKQLTFDDSDYLTQTFLHPSLTVGTYIFSLEMLIPNSNGYLKEASATINILSKFSSGTQLGNQFQIKLTWPLEFNGNLVNTPIDCNFLFESANITLVSPMECNHNKNTINIIVKNTSNLVQSSIFHLRPISSFSESVNYTVPNNLPEITITGGGTYTSGTPITLTALPTDITGFLPTYTWSQVSGNEPLGLNASLTTLTQTFPVEALSAGEFVFQVVMGFPPSSLGYTRKALGTFDVQAAFVRGEQYGGRFRLYLNYAVWFGGSRRNLVLGCGDVIDAGTIALLQPSLCAHNEDILTIYASNQSTGNVVSLLTQTFYTAPISYTGPSGMPTLLPIVQSGSDPWESSDIGNSFTTTNSNCDGLQVWYVWEVVSGNPLPQLAAYIDSDIVFEPMSLPAGDYTIKCSMYVAEGNGYISSQTVDFTVNVGVFVHSQKGSVITILMSGGFYLNGAIEGNSTCSNILPPAFIAKMGPTPMCQHKGAMLRAYLSNPSLVADGDSFDLSHPHFTTTAITDLKAFAPSLALSVPSSMGMDTTNQIHNQLRKELLEVKGELTGGEGLGYALTWSQGAGEPSTILFDNSLLTQVIGEELLKEGNYSVRLGLVFDNSNSYELIDTVNITYASIPTARITGGEQGLNYNMELELRTYLSLDNDIGSFSTELKWTWTASANSDFSTPAVLVNDEEFNPATYANKDIKFGPLELKWGMYYFKVRVSKWEYFVDESSTEVEVYEGGPTIKLAPYTIAPKHNPTKDLCVQAFVSSYLGLPIQNNWYVKPKPLELEKTSEKVCILAQFILPGTLYVITHEATEIPNTRRELAGYTRRMTTKLGVSRFPMAGEFEITPKGGKGLTDIFTFKLNNWYDTEGTNLKYIILAQIVGSDIGFLAVNSYTSLETFNTFLPVGDPLYNYLLTIRIQAINEYGAPIYKDFLVKAIEPTTVGDPEVFLDESLFKDFEDKPLSDQLFRMSSATYLAKLPQVDLVEGDACGGCGENGECLALSKVCRCGGGYQGMHCEYPPPALESVIAVTTTILGSILYIYIYYIYIYIIYIYI